MQTSQNTSERNEQDSAAGIRWFDRVWASFIFFTRLPLWRLHQPPTGAYRCVVEHWPLAGWLTASAMAAVLYFASLLFPYPIAILLAIVTRLLLTGALHEDGLADFFDGFGGGGNDRQRILAIMKDSHIGTYGVLALVVYVGLLFAALYAMPPYYAALTILAADPYAKMAAAQAVQMLPYARDEETAKARVVYRKYSLAAGLSLAVQGLLPMGLYLWMMGGHVNWEIMIAVPFVVMYALYQFIWHRLRGYTGDCCGALFLLIELSVYLIASVYLAG
ncbi:MAG: adenosylcobinamide-GDP ribazoletransferase [Bacteroidaceae bacterium]|nr:adenosylcobinamide-GDP ribazoletransferase [Bacteroidaceae bacterium]MBR1789220.1 adenosylcobinamide-GDP ribazoletransferase [Bacteroidaceae bacterium]